MKPHIYKIEQDLRIGECMKKIIGLISFIIILGCAASSERMRADDFYAKGDYIKALKTYESALEKSKIESQREEIQKKLEKTKVKIVDAALIKADAAYKKIDPLSLQSADEAIVILEECSVDDKAGRISTQIQKYKNIQKRIIYGEAKAFKAKGEYSHALTAYQRANEIDPNDKKLANEISSLTAFIEKEKKVRLNKINKLLKVGNGEKAKAVFDQLALMDPDDPGLEKLRKKLSVARKKQVLSKAAAYESKNKFFSAHQMLMDSDVEGIEKEISQVAKKGGKYYLGKAQAHLEAGRLYLAYIASVKARELSPNDIRISQMNKKCADLVNDKIQKYIAILTFGSPANHPDTGMLFSDALITRLFKELPYGINIVEKEKINLLENAKKMEIKNIGGSLGADIVIKGNVSLFKVEEIKSEGMATAKIKIGEEETVNPEYDRMIRAYGNDKNNWPKKIDRIIRKDKYKSIEYKKGTFSKKAFGKVSIRIYDAVSGKLVFSEDFDDTLEKKDVFQDPVEEADIPGDPLEMPLDTEIKAELREKMVRNISNAVVRILQNREKRFWKSAALRMDRNEYKNAIKFLAQGDLFCRNSNTDNEYSKKLHTMMIRLTEIE